jgi:molecular chaperone DnaK
LLLLNVLWDILAEITNEAKRVSYKVVKGDNNTPRVDIDGRLYTAQELSAMTLRKKLLKTI